eukprot:4717271-Pleurochrysis_carterae.AAC.2
MRGEKKHVSKAIQFHSATLVKTGSLKRGLIERSASFGSAAKVRSTKSSQPVASTTASGSTRTVTGASDVLAANSHTFGSGLPPTPLKWLKGSTLTLAMLTFARTKYSSALLSGSMSSTVYRTATSVTVVDRRCCNIARFTASHRRLR